MYVWLLLFIKDKSSSTKFYESKHGQHAYFDIIYIRIHTYTYTYPSRLVV